MSKAIKLTKDPIWELLRKVTIPASVGSLFQTFYNLVDTWFAGRISAEAIGAIAKSFPIYFVIIAVGVGAQLVEQGTENPCAGGSSPPLGTTLNYYPQASNRSHETLF